MAHEDVTGVVMVNAGLMQLIKNLLQRDVDEGSSVRGEIITELDHSIEECNKLYSVVKK